MRKDESFGVIPLVRAEGDWNVFLIQHAHGRYWGFPKGHAEPNESPQQAALRELKEETNLDHLRWLSPEPFVESYSFIFEGKRVFKKVFYFVAEVTGTVSLQPEEIQDGVWLPVSEARERLTHREGKAILAKVESFLKGKE